MRRFHYEFILWCGINIAVDFCSRRRYCWRAVFSLWKYISSPTETITVIITRDIRDDNGEFIANIWGFFPFAFWYENWVMIGLDADMVEDLLIKHEHVRTKRACLRYAQFLFLILSMLAISKMSNVWIEWLIFVGGEGRRLWIERI